MPSPLDAYSYTLPPELIAHSPARPRESAKLFVYDTATNTVTIATVADLPHFVPRALMVVNDTTVVPARVHGQLHDREIELLLLVDQGVSDGGEVRSLVNRRVHSGGVITVPGGYFTVLDASERAVRLQYSGGKHGILSLLQQAGETPLPPYINSPAAESERRTQYQSVFAAADAPSVAAPTASLHFTPRLRQGLVSAGVHEVPVTLQVGLGTFAPVYASQFQSGKLHEEHFFVSERSAQTIHAAYATNRPILAVGTTVLRTLESAKEAIAKPEGQYGVTDIFIYPPHGFTYPTMLLTNFHVPKSSLMCLVQAFIEHKGGTKHITELYTQAIKEHFRFYSFGDAMLVL